MKLLLTALWKKNFFQVMIKWFSAIENGGGLR